MGFEWPEPSRALLLFDIDGTLLRGRGAGRQLMATAFGRALSREVTDVDLRTIPFHGNTDPSIVRAGLEGLGERPTAENVDAVIAHYLGLLEDACRTSRPFEALPHAERLCRALRNDGFELGLGTGNVERAAYLKVDAIALSGLFSYGGFGSDHHERAELLRAGMARGASRLGRDLTDCEVVVIGDTLRDIEAARAIGARVIAVATGGNRMDELAQALPDLLVETLEAVY